MNSTELGKLCNRTFKKMKSQYKNMTMSDIQSVATFSVMLLKEHASKDEDIPKEDLIYMRNGYKNREDYLESLSEDMNVPIDMVRATADILGPSEDFDGLVSALNDELV